MKTEAMYATMKPWRLFFKVAIPGMISMLAMSIYTIVEGIFLGQTLGEGAFAAVNIALPMVMINFSVADLIGVGASAPISIALGKNDHDAANNIFTCSVLLIFLASTVLGAILFFAAEALGRMVGAEGVLLDTATRYLRVSALCSPLASIFFAMDNYLRISGYVKTSMAINVISNLLTIGMLAFFLLVCKMDVVGSALAVSLSMCASSAVAMIPFIRKKALLQFVKPKFSVSMLRRIAACGSPSFLSNISGRIVSVLMNISLMRLGVKALGENGGTTAVAVYAILMYASDFCWPMLYGISDSLSPAIGYNWGAQNFGRVKKIAACGFIGTAVVGLVSSTALFGFPGVVAALFAKGEDFRLLQMSTHAIRLFCLAYVFRWLVVMTQSFLSALEKPLQAATVSVGTALVFPVILLGALWNLGLNGIWLNFAGVNMIAAILCVVFLIFLYKEIKAKQEAQR